MYDPEMLIAAMSEYCRHYVQEQAKNGFADVGGSWKIVKPEFDRVIVDVHVKGYTGFFVEVETIAYTVKRMWPRFYTTLPDIR